MKARLDIFLFTLFNCIVHPLKVIEWGGFMDVLSGYVHGFLT